MKGQKSNHTLTDFPRPHRSLGIRDREPVLGPWGPCRIERSVPSHQKRQKQDESKVRRGHGEHLSRLFTPTLSVLSIKKYNFPCFWVDVAPFQWDFGALIGVAPMAFASTLSLWTSWFMLLVAIIMTKDALHPHRDAIIVSLTRYMLPSWDPESNDLKTIPGTHLAPSSLLITVPNGMRDKKIAMWPRLCAKNLFKISNSIAKK